MTTTFNMNSGYSGFSMSNRAVEAYEVGEKPISKWTKQAILDEVEDFVSDEIYRALNKKSVKVLKDKFLKCTSWHHIGSMCKKTDFYSVDIDRINSYTVDEIEALNIKESAPTEEIWVCEFLVWSGTKRHPKASVHTEKGIVKGNWFYREDGSKKKTDANGFKFIRKVEK